MGQHEKLTPGRVRLLTGAAAGMATNAHEVRSAASAVPRNEETAFDWRAITLWWQ